MYSLEGKTAIVTGAGSGMGRATVLALLEAGAAVVAGDVNETGLASLPSSSKLAVSRCDVTDSADAQNLVELAVTRFGALNLVYNVAGICLEEPFVEAGKIWQRTMDINLNGVANVCRSAIPALKQAGGGSIVNWASINAFEAAPELSAYCVSKAAVMMLTRCIAVDYAADGIRANAICPGHVGTPMMERVASTYSSEEEWLESVVGIQPLGLGTAEEIADVAVFLGSNASRHMTGSAVMVDGGQLARSSSLIPPQTQLAKNVLQSS
jgi:NAD(P)-dependent dehydrogenase (short-subunit alcohol dehydrogenase family)